MRRAAEANAQIYLNQFNDFVNAYIKEQIHPDCDPEMKFKGTLPGGMMVYGPTKDLVYQKIIEVVYQSEETK